jgi:three-Cys-motif partner protein
VLAFLTIVPGALLMTVAFFDVQTDESRVKTDIVENFFVSWAKVISGHQKKRHDPVALAYVDLFAGPGKYLDGSESTPLRILRQILKVDEWKSNTLLLFNEADEELLKGLRRNLDEADAAALRVSPAFGSDVVTANYRGCLRHIEGRPALFFIDPWGYKGIALRLLRDFVSGFGNDLIFFFNYRRINAAVSNDLFAERMDELFGTRSQSLRRDVARLHGFAREEAIIAAASEEISENVAQHVQKFRFARSGGEASHYLFFVSKSPRGHEIMTNIMAKRSSDVIGGVPTFEFTQKGGTGWLFQPDQIEELARTLMRDLSGKRLSVDSIYTDHGSGKQLQRKHYKQALLRLEARGDVEMNPPAEKRRTGTLADHVMVKFLGRAK